MNVKKLIWSILLGLVATATVMCVGLLALFSLWFPHETHSLHSYARLLAEWDQDLVGHFPQKIPASASSKKFSHYPGFLQASAHIQLRLELPPGHIEQLHAHFLQQRTRSFFGGDSSRHMNQTNGMPTTDFRTGDRGQRSFPPDYEIMVLDQPDPKSVNPNWNHGRSHGVAISGQRNEIIYWAESW